MKKPAKQPKPVMGRPKLPESERKVGIGISCAPQTWAKLEDWRRELPRKPRRPHLGQVVDKLAEHGKRTDFNPNKP